HDGWRDTLNRQPLVTIEPHDNLAGGVGHLADVAPPMGGADPDNGLGLPTIIIGRTAVDLRALLRNCPAAPRSPPDDVAHFTRMDLAPFGKDRSGVIKG